MQAALFYNIIVSIKFTIKKTTRLGGFFIEILKKILT